MMSLMIVSSVTSLITVVKKKTGCSGDDTDNFIQQCCVLALARLADLMANKVCNVNVWIIIIIILL